MKNIPFIAHFLARVAFLSAVAAGSILLPDTARAARPALGKIATHFHGNFERVLADPQRDRFYALNSSDNAMLVVDTAHMASLGAFGVGVYPVDMAFSPDKATLYFANSGSTGAAVTAIDVKTLHPRTTVGLPTGALAIAVGPDNRVYAAAHPLHSAEIAIYQLDATAGTIQQVFNQGLLLNRYFATSVDGQTLYTAGYGYPDGTLTAFDISSVLPTMGQVNSRLYSNPQRPVVSHAGKYICVPGSDGSGGVSTYETALLSSADIGNYFGAFSLGSDAGPLAFSPDDSLVYHTTGGYANKVEVFNTHTFTVVDDAYLPLAIDASDIACDRTGSYLAVAYSAPGSEATLEILTTGRGTLTPASLLPALLDPEYDDGELATFVPFIYQVAATNHPTHFEVTGLPTGLTLNPDTGLITGTPTTVGRYPVIISASNASGAATEQRTWSVSSGAFRPKVPKFVTLRLPAAVATHAYSTRIEATNKPNYFVAYDLPEGLGIDQETGVIAGTPVKAGTSSVSLNVQNDDGGADAVLTLVVDDAPPAAPILTSDTTATGALDVPFVYQVAARNVPESFAATGLPVGLTIDVNGAISGTPAAVGTFSVKLSAANAYGTGTATLRLTILRAPLPVITSALAAGATRHRPFTYQIEASNTPAGFSAIGLPAGLSVDGSGLITGTPTVEGVFTVVLGATNAGGTGRAALLLTIVSDLPSVTIAATAPHAILGFFPGVLTITRTGDLSEKLVVRYSLKGSAKNGVDYELRSGKVKIKARYSSATVRIAARIRPDEATAKKVKVSLLPQPGYELGAASRARVKIDSSNYEGLYP